MIQRYNPAPDQGSNATRFTRFVTNANGSCVLWKDHEAERERILEICNTPEWFDTPCARAIREALKRTDAELTEKAQPLKAKLEGEPR